MPEPNPEGNTSCPNCGYQLRSGARFCPSCGNSLTVSAVPPERRERTSLFIRYRAQLGELKLVGWLFGLLLFGSLVLGMISRVDSSPLPDAAVSTAEAVLVLIFVAFRRRDVLPLLGRPQIDGQALRAMAALSVAFVVVMALYFGVMESFGMPVFRYTDSYLNAGWPLWSMFVLISLMPAVFEELAFRGVIYAALGRVFAARESWLIQAALFSVLHLMPIAFPSHFLMGLFFGWLRTRSNSLYPAMLAHAGWNALVLCEELYL